jgi:NAD(P)H dehydrogenase (quinone)
MANLKAFIVCIFLSFVTCVQAQKNKKVLITYYSKTNATHLMANAVAKGVESNKEVQLIFKSIEQTSQEDLLQADAIILGSPVYNANAAPEVLDFIRKWPFENKALKDKVGAVFVTAGGISAGEELVQVNLLHAMMIYGMVVMGGDEWTAAFGASAITHENPFEVDKTKNIDPIFLNKGFALGKRVAEWVKRIK